MSESQGPKDRGKGIIVEDKSQKISLKDIEKAVPAALRETHLLYSPLDQLTEEEIEQLVAMVDGWTEKIVKLSALLEAVESGTREIGEEMQARARELIANYEKYIERARERIDRWKRRQPSK